MEEIFGGNLIVMGEIIKYIIALIIIVVIIWFGVRFWKFVNTGDAGKGVMGDFIKYNPISLQLRATKGVIKGIKKTGDAYKRHRVRKKARTVERRAEIDECAKYKKHSWKRIRCRDKARFKKRR